MSRFTNYDTRCFLNNMTRGLLFFFFFGIRGERNKLQTPTAPPTTEPNKRITSVLEGIYTPTITLSPPKTPTTLNAVCSEWPQVLAQNRRMTSWWMHTAPPVYPTQGPKECVGGFSQLPGFPFPLIWVSTHGKDGNSRNALISEAEITKWGKKEGRRRERRKKGEREK